MTLGKGEEVDEENNKKQHRKESFSWNFVNVGCLYIHVCLKIQLCQRCDFIYPLIKRDTLKQPYMQKMEVLKCWKKVEFPKILVKIKNCKTFYGAQTASSLKEIIQPNPSPPSLPQPTPYQIKSY